MLAARFPKSVLILLVPAKFLELGGEAYLSRGNSGISDDMEPSSSNQLEYDENSALELKKMSHNTLMGVVKFLQKKRSNIIEKATAEGIDEVVSDVVGHTFVSYESSHPKRSTKGRVNIPLNLGAREMAALLDTALLQALLLTGQTISALLELYKCNSLHRVALKLLHQLAEESKSDEPKIELT